MAAGKKRLQNGDLDGSDPKRVKSESSEENTIWEWEDDGHVWTAFSTDLTKEIDTAFKAGLQKIKVTINDIKLDIIFERMVQRNAKTFWERRIRANKEGEDGGLSGMYEFEEDNGSWTRYDHSVQRLLYAANIYKLNKVTFPAQGQKYTIDLKKLEQVNDKTKRKRSIREGDQNGDTSSTVTEAVSQESHESLVKAVSRRSTRRQKVAVKEESEAEEEEEEEKEKTTIKKSKSQSSRSKSEQEEENPVVKSITFKGKVPVDQECFAKEKYHVYYEGETVYDGMLNQTNLKNNNNKFYLMQILQTHTNTSYAVWFRWGRVGMIGQSNLTNCGNDLEQAKDMFCKKFFDKTKNEFSDRKKFKKVQGKYDLLFMDYNSTEKDEVDAQPKAKKEKNIPESKLDKKLQALVELLCNVKEMEEAVMEMKYDTKKAPLGKLTKEQIKAGYKALRKIDQCITNKKTDNELIKACDAFYTRVPHCFGMQRPPVIRTKRELKLKIELLETLGDIEIAMKVINEETNKLLNPVDQHYLALKCELKALNHDSEDFKIIDKYTQNTHAKTHNQYKMEVVDIFEVSDSRQDKQFNDVGNRMLLWHGSRLTNWVGILSQGLRVAPPEAPVTGYMFGKGVYFADVSSKSANYCYPTRSKNTGFVLLCEVALGKTHDLLAADYEANELPSGYNSTKGLGKIAPDEKDNVSLSDGVVVPLGCPQDTGVDNPNGYTLNYNEYVVYDTRQVKSRYMVQLKFHFK